MTFPDTIIALNRGAQMVEVNEKLAEVIAAVRATAKTGSVTLTLKIAPGSRGNADMVFVNASITAKLPQPDAPATLFFTTPDNRITRHNEQQEDLPFEVVRVVEMNSAKEAM